MRISNSNFWVHKSTYLDVAKIGRFHFRKYVFIAFFEAGY
jgi:hypothetical protein